MYKILISGYYGFENIGDESILRAVVDSLRDRLDSGDEKIEITVLSHDPTSTMAKYGVKACQRKSIIALLRAVCSCDLLISGGGSLLQDVTSKKSILYYLFIMWLAKIFGKDFFVYSQGIGPINSNFNRRLTARLLSHASGIVVRDESSKEFLVEIGVDSSRVVVTADPVLRIKKADLSFGKQILINEGCKFFNTMDKANDQRQFESELKDQSKGERGRLSMGQIVGFAVKERKLESDFVKELADSASWLIRERGCKVVLIPFHYNEDMALIEELESRLSRQGLSDSVCAIKHKYLTDEMLSIIGNMDVLVGVRLHSLIHAAIMGVPMIGISYDPKVNSFMNSMGLKAMCSIFDFKSEFFIEEYDKTLIYREQILSRVEENVSILRAKLDTNEDLIKRLMSKGRK